jgi:hypothetical protein
MKPLRWLATVAVSCLLCLAPLSADTLQDEGRRLIRQCLAAVGGDAFLQMRDKVSRGRAYQFYDSRLSGLSIVTIYTKYDPKPSSPEPGWIGIRERRDYGKNADYSFLFADGKIFDITFRGARLLPEARLREYEDRLRRDVFYILKYRLDEPGMIFESAGSELLQNQETQKLRITDANNASVTVYLDKFSHLPARLEYMNRDPKTRDVSREMTSYSRYRNTSGVQLPANTQAMRDGEKIAESFLDEIEINKNLNDSLFTVKPGVKVLPADK